MADKLVKGSFRLIGELVLARMADVVHGCLLASIISCVALSFFFAFLLAAPPRADSLGKHVNILFGDAPITAAFHGVVGCNEDGLVILLTADGLHSIKIYLF